MQKKRKAYRQPSLVKQQNLRDITFSDPGMTCSLPETYSQHHQRTRRRHGRRW